MEAAMWVCRWGLFVLLFVFGGSSFMVSADSVAAAAATCPAGSSAVDSVLPPLDLCPATWGSPVDGGYGDVLTLNRLVIEGDELALQKALHLVHMNRNRYIAVLFYASWCPFSKRCKPNFSTLSSLFPTIIHFAFEESNVKPSTLSRYGVHGFPTLFLFNSTMRVRYRGSRTIKSLSTFYSDVTGIRSLASYSFNLEIIGDLQNLENKTVDNVEQEFCPFSWAKSPENLFREETYLALAIAFLLMRILYILLPKLLACAKKAWSRHIHNATLMSLLDNPHAYIDGGMRAFSRLYPTNRSNLQGGAMNAKAWASKSLASVSIGEPSTSRTLSGNDRR
ncbi:5'-adenylylsulfate reductase-like 3 [Acorus calamus]|uniref:5'-adenylylsulfate reductase-like 3 n=1 Tax=Acorus calamus TaxID=4465 RepID=A0AAV9E4R8_ACOCL|nr:5'-adenylylsulfate reductase-like 3 [Acorus calamus]